MADKQPELTEKELIEIRKKDILNNFEQFYPHFVSQVIEINEHNKYVHNWHMDFIGYHIKKVLTGENDRCIWNMCPGSLKTISGICLALLYMAYYPTTRIVILSQSEDIQLKYSKYIKTIIESDFFKELFPHISIDYDSPNRVDKFFIKDGGSFTLFSLGKDITGSDADMLIVDDPHNYNAFKKRGLVSIQNEIEQVKSLKTRLRDVKGRRTVMVMIMQRICKGDVTDYALDVWKYDHWSQVKIPAVENRRDIYNKVEKKYGHIYEYYGHKLFMEEGQLTNPIRLNTEKLQSLKTAFEGRIVDFNYQLQQENNDEGTSIFTLGMIRRYEPSNLPNIKIDFYCMSLDTAFGGMYSDYSVIMLWGVDEEEQKIYLIDIFAGQWKYDYLRDLTVEIYKQYDCQHIVIESAVSGIVLIQDMEKEIYGRAIENGEKLKNKRVIAVKPQKEGDKINRALRANTLIEAGKVYFPYHIDKLALLDGVQKNVMDEFDFELKVFPQEGGSGGSRIRNDYVDAFSSFLNFFKKEFVDVKGPNVSEAITTLF